MNSHNITNESLALALMLVVVAILISHKEKLALEKDILWSVARAVVQLIIVGYVLKYIFKNIISNDKSRQKLFFFYLVRGVFVSCVVNLRHIYSTKF